MSLYKSLHIVRRIIKKLNNNFKKIFSLQGDYVAAIGHTLLFGVCTTLMKSLSGLILALLLDNNFRSRELLRGIYFLPFAISPLIIGIIFTSVLHPQWGVLNEILRAVGLDFLAKNWLVDKSIATAVFRTYSAGAYGLSTALNVVVFVITAIIAISTLKIITPKEE